ncbi:MAG: DUF6069 family protein [Chloroflexota bacterium]|nr:DUF6069 family protein [Chloroflexota bacterium]
MASTITHEYIALRKLLWIGPLAIVSAVIANLVVRAIAVAFLGVSETFQYFQATYIIGSTIIYLLLALVAFVLVSRFAHRPIHFYRVLALVALLVSFLIPAMALSGLLPTPGINAPIFWTMIVMHSVSAVIVVGLLTTLTRKQA